MSNIQNNSKAIVVLDENSFNSITSETNANTTKKDNKTAKTTIFDYSYVVLIGAFIAYMLATLIGGVFGVVFDNLETELGLSRSKAATIGALITSLDNLLGPISSAFINRYGCRKTTILGGFLSAIGVIGGAFATEFWQLSLLIGGLTGFGSSLVTVSTVVVATYYFEDKPSFASGFVISGGSLSSTIFPLVVIKILELYGRRGCFLILGALILNIIACGALFRPLYWELEGYIEGESSTGIDDDDDDDEDYEESEVIEIDDDDDDENYIENDHEVKIEAINYNFDVVIPVNTKFEEKKTGLFQIIKEFFNRKDESTNEEKLISSPIPILTIEKRHQHHHHPYKHENIPDFMNHFPLNLRNYYYKSLLNLNSRLTANLSPTILSFNNSPLEGSVDNLNSTLITTENTENSTKLSLSCPNLSVQKINKEITVDDLNYRLKKYSKLIQNKKRQQQLELLKQQQKQNQAKEQGDEKGEEKGPSLTFTRIWKRMFKFFKGLGNSIVETVKLLRKTEFTLFVICNFIICIFYETPFYFINSYMVENGFTHNQAGIINVIVGIAGIIAAIAYGYIGDLKNLNWVLIYSISIYLTAFCHFILPMIISNYILIMVTMILMSMSISVIDVLVPMICVNTVGNDDFVSAYGFIFFFQGVASLIGPPFLGMVVDYTGRYAYSYNLGGIGLSVTATLLLLLLVFKNVKKIKKRNRRRRRRKKLCSILFIFLINRRFYFYKPSE